MADFIVEIIHQPNKEPMAIGVATPAQNQGVVQTLMMLGYTKLGDRWFKRDEIDVVDMDTKKVTKGKPAWKEPNIFPDYSAPRKRIASNVVDVDAKEIK